MSRVRNMIPEELRLDELNPRLHMMKEERTQRAMAAHLMGEYQAVRLACNMADGLYLAQAPLLVIQGEWEPVVIDGNRRLAAAMTAADPTLAEEAGVRELTVDRAGKTWAPPASDAMPVLLVGSRWEAMRARIIHERAARTIWGHLGHARHYVELLRDGRTPREISGLYGYDGWIHGAMSVQSEVEALQVLQQVDAVQEHPWLSNSSHQRLGHALRIPAVRGMLGMDIVRREEVDPDGKPIPAGKMGEAAQLVRWIQGSARDSGEFQHAQVRPARGRPRAGAGMRESRRNCPDGAEPEHQRPFRPRPAGGAGGR